MGDETLALGLEGLVEVGGDLIEGFGGGVGFLLLVGWWGGGGAVGRGLAGGGV